MKRFELRPMHINQKSFYGKALLEENENGDVTLVSYNTDILTVTIDGKFIPHWSGYSMTTQKHINEFISQLMGGSAML